VPHLSYNRHSIVRTGAQMVAVVVGGVCITADAVWLLVLCRAINVNTHRALGVCTCVRSAQRGDASQ